MVKSKFSFYVYLNLLLSIAFVTLSVFLLLSPELSAKSAEDKNSPAPFAGLLVLPLSVLLFYIITKKANLIRINSETIFIKGIFVKKIIQKTEVASIDLLAITDFYWSAGNKTTSIKIQLANAKDVIIGDPFYKNIDELKSYFFKYYGEKVIGLPEFNNIKDRNTMIRHEEIIFTGNPFLNFYTILFCGWCIAMGYIFFDPLGKWTFIVIIPIAIMYLRIGKQMHYFVLSDGYLTIRNHFFFWTRKRYLLKEILQVNVEKPYRASKSLRIITKGFKSKLYSASSLQRRHWASLLHELKDEGIQVRQAL